MTEHPSGCALDTDTYRMLVEQAQVGLLVIQAHRIRFVNPHLAAMFGYTPQQLLGGMDPKWLTAPEHHERVAKATEQRESGVEGRPYVLRFVRKDGSAFNGRVWGRSIRLDGQPANLVTLHDMTEVEQASLAVQRREHLLAQTEELALIGSSEYDVATGVVSQSAGMFRIFGEPVVDGPTDGEWLMSRVPAGEDGFVRGLLAGVRPGVPCEFEHRIRHADGSLRTVVHRVTAEVDGRGRTTRVIGLLQDITAQRAAERQRDWLANSDSVTRLPNRAALLDKLDASLRQARREERPIALITLAIDQLKLVGESLGYAGADQLLALVAERLSERVEGRDVLAHLGSGLYAALVTLSAEDSGTAVTAQAFFDALARPFTVGGIEVSVSCAVGIAHFPRDGAQAADELLHQAQAALHRAQEQAGPAAGGQGSRICHYTAEANARAATRLAMEAGLRRALERQEFRLVYQPQLSLTSGEVIGVEALIRWVDAARGQAVPPGDFIPIAEETGLIVPIGDWVLRAACEQSMAWQRAGLPPVRMAVNLSVRQLQLPDIAGRIQAILLERGMDPRRLGLEMTESVLVSESEHVARTLGELKAIGIEISIDDFGTGYSNLSYLRKLPIDVVKVDRSFVHDVTAAPQDVSMTRAVITMAHSLQMKVLAEGVETEGQLALLIAHRCDQMQGYYFSRPLEADALAALLRERRGLPAHLLTRRAAERTLLLVDDDAEALAALERALQPDGHRIVTACGGEDGLRRLGEQPVDAVLAAQRLTGLAGVDFLRRVQALQPDTVRFVLAGADELAAVADAVEDGTVDKVLRRPGDGERLRRQVRQALQHKALADENRRLGARLQASDLALATAQARLDAAEAHQRAQNGRDEMRLTVADDLLHGLPAPVIGTDADGLVVFVNAAAEALFAADGPLLMRHVSEALPAALRAVWAAGDGAAHALEVQGRACRAVCRPMGGEGDAARGKLLLLMPSEAAGPRDADRG